MAEYIELQNIGERKRDEGLHPIICSTDYSHDPANIPQRDINNFRTAFHYEIRKQIGKGAFGTVYSGIFTQNVITWYRRHKVECAAGERFAIKYISIQAKPHPMVTDWYDEPIAMIELDHRNLVNLFSVITMSGKRLYIIMEYCDRGSMYELLTKIDNRILCRKPISEYQSHQWCNHVLLGLQHIHSHNWAHQDIHTGNILLTTDPQNRREILAKISDFGLVKPFTDERQYDDLKALAIAFTHLLFLNGHTSFRSDQTKADANNMVRMLAQKQYNTVDRCLTDGWLTSHIEPDSGRDCGIM